MHVLRVLIPLQLAITAAVEILEATVECRRTEMVVTIEVDKPFNGTAFARSYYQHCRVDGNGSTSTILLKLPLNLVRGRSPYCGAILDGENGIMTRLLISDARDVLVDGMRELEIHCTYNLSTVTVRAPAAIEIETTNVEPFTAIAGRAARLTPPTMSIRDGNGIDGVPISTAHIGQPLSVDIHQTEPSDEDAVPIDLFLFNCVAHNGSRWPTSLVTLIDRNGCMRRIERVLEGTLEKSTDDEGRLHVHFSLSAFQFSGSNLVYFECQVKPCLEKCSLPICGGTNSRARNRRNSLPLSSDGSEVVGATLRVLDPSLAKLQPPAALHAYEEEHKNQIITATVSNKLNHKDGLCISNAGITTTITILVVICLVCFSAGLYFWFSINRDRILLFNDASSHEQPTSITADANGHDLNNSRMKRDTCTNSSDVETCVTTT